MVWPATVRVPERDEMLVFAAILKAALPFPLPLAPDVIDSHEALAAAVHVQPVAAVTLVVPDPAADA
jgi:hypothetical protein